MYRSHKVALILFISIVLMTSTSIAEGNVIDDISGEFFFDYNYNKEILDISPYEGSIRPSHPMYELRIGFWNMDETFTNDETERLGKQISAARQFIAETITELNEGDEENADIALGYYSNKIEDMDHTLAGLNLNSVDLTYANEMNQKNCEAIEKLAIHARNQNMNRTMLRLEYALNYSLQLGYNFTWRHQHRNNNVQSNNVQESGGQMGSGQESGGQMGSGQENGGQTGSGKGK